MSKLVEHFKEHLPLNISLVNKLHKLGENTDDPETLNRHLPSLIVPIGLALQGVEHASVPLNLIPHEILKEREQSRKIPLFAASSLIFLAAGFWHFNAVNKAGEVLKVLHRKPQNKLNDCKQCIEDIEKQKNKIAPRLTALKSWKQLLREPDTHFDRNAYQRVLSALHKALYRETTNDRDMLFIEEVSIQKQLVKTNQLSLLINKVKGLPELGPAQQIFQVKITGSFFEQPGGDAQNIRHTEERIVSPIAKFNDIFFNWQSLSTKSFVEEGGAPMKRFIVQGYFAPRDYLKFQFLVDHE
jgi:hypothetical protein